LFLNVGFCSGKAYSEKVDSFNFGVLLWQLMARQMPHRGRNHVEVNKTKQNKTKRNKVSYNLAGGG
jgi:hypothetical protein